MKIFVALLLFVIATPCWGQTIPCKQTMKECPDTGCAAKGTPEADANRIRRRRPTAPKAELLRIEDFESLQVTANRIGLQGFAISVGDRKKYEKLKIGNRTIGEGMLVAVHGYIVGTPHARRTDSSNCRLVGRANNSYRIHVAALPDDTEFDAIIVEMIPQHRNERWTLEILRFIARHRKPVRVAGQLFYDSKKLVNSDPNDELIGQPRRLSLWEIHPITEFMACVKCTVDECEAGKRSGWIPLEQVTTEWLVEKGGEEKPCD